MKTWYSIIAAAESNVAHVILQDEIGIGKSVQDFERELLELHPEKILLSIDSIGGSWLTGIKLFEILSKFAVETTISGQCWSTAILPAMAGFPIRIAREASILIHSPSQYVCGTAEELFMSAVEVERLRHFGAEILRHRTQQPLKTVDAWLAQDTWFTAAEAIAARLADELEPIAEKCHRESPAPATEQPGKLAPTKSETFFKEWLSAFGTVETTDRPKFLRDLAAWADYRVIEKSGGGPTACRPTPAGEDVCPAGGQTFQMTT